MYCGVPGGRTEDVEASRVVAHGSLSQTPCRVSRVTSVCAVFCCLWGKGELHSVYTIQNKQVASMALEKAAVGSGSQ